MYRVIKLFRGASKVAYLFEPKECISDFVNASINESRNK